MNRVRTLVYDHIEEHCGDYAAYAAKVFKPSLPETERDAASLHSLAFKWLVSAVFEN